MKKIILLTILITVACSLLTVGCGLPLNTTKTVRPSETTGSTSFNYSSDSTSATVNSSDLFEISQINESLIGQQVTLQGRLRQIDRFDSGHSMAYLYDSLTNDKIKIYIHRDTQIDLFTLITDHSYNISGKVDLYNGILEVAPQKQSDINITGKINFEEVFVDKVVDGDTLHVIDSKGNILTVRMIGVDTPELGKNGRPDEYYAYEATEFTASLVNGRKIWLEKDYDDTDQYGRKLRYIWLSLPDQITSETVKDNLLSALLIENGYGGFVHYNKDRKYKELLTELETAAKSNQTGIWSN